MERAETACPSCGGPGCPPCNGTGRRFRTHVQLKQTDNEVTVSGPYIEMADIHNKLRNRGFKWDKGKRAWRAQREKLSSTQLLNIEALIRSKPV